MSKLLKVLSKFGISETSGSAYMASKLFIANVAFLKWIVDIGAITHIIGDSKNLLGEGIIENIGE